VKNFEIFAGQIKNNFILSINFDLSGGIMARTTIYLNNVQLSRINPVFSTIHPGWTQRVEAIFTENKTDPVWANDQFADGVTLAATVREQTRFLNGIIAVDLSKQMYQMSGSMIAGSNQIVFAKPTLDEVRQRIFKTLTHELLHVLQGWVWGEQWNTRYLAARQEIYSKDIIRQHQMLDRGDQPYLGYKNRYELAAFSYGTDWVSQHRDQLKAGLFDDLIPISAIKKLF
jgi:hypothetical protein